MRRRLTVHCGCGATFYGHPDDVVPLWEAHKQDCVNEVATAKHDPFQDTHTRPAAPVEIDPVQRVGIGGGKTAAEFAKEAREKKKGVKPFGDEYTTWEYRP